MIFKFLNSATLLCWNRNGGCTYNWHCGCCKVARFATAKSPGFLSHNVSLPSEAALVIPTQWTPESVKWHAKVAGYGQSTPVVYDSVAYVTSVQGENKDSYFLEAFLISTGERLWEINTKNSHPVASTPMVSRSAPTPVVDQTAVYVFYESGDLQAVSLDGKALWSIDLQDRYGKLRTSSAYLRAQFSQTIV